MSTYPHYLERLQAATRKYWDKPALNTLGGDSLTYAEMATAIARFHIIFEKAGFKKGDKIALCANNGARWGFAYLAVNTYETVIVPILADFTPESGEPFRLHRPLHQRRALEEDGRREDARPEGGLRRG